MSKEHAAPSRGGVVRFNIVFDRIHLRFHRAIWLREKGKSPGLRGPRLFPARDRSILTLAVGDTAFVDEMEVHRTPLLAKADTIAGTSWSQASSPVTPVNLTPNPFPRGKRNNKWWAEDFECE